MIITLNSNNAKNIWKQTDHNIENNNLLFRNSQKATYSMPQSLPFSEAILKCACGYDYMAIITATNKLYFLFQTKFYAAQNVPLLVDVATSQNTVTMVTTDNQILVWDFDEQKIVHKNINYTKIKLSLERDDYIKQVQMGSNDIFLLSQTGKVYHFKRNQWYQTKSYSNIESVELSHKIIDVSSGPKSNLFLSYEGLLFQSSKQDPLHLTPVNTKFTFTKIASNFYNAGITKKGTVMIWGNSIHGNFNDPTQFSKLTKKFLDVKLDKQNGYALADDGQVWVWGVNSNGELGLSDYETRIKPFPLITLQKFTTFQIFCGHSYACCICKPSQKTNNNSIKVIDRKVSQFIVSKQEVRQAGKKQNPIYIELQQYQISDKEFVNNYSPFNKRKQQASKLMKKRSQTTKNQASSMSNKKQTYMNQNNKSKQKYLNSAYPRKSSWLISERQNESDSHEISHNNLQTQLNQLRLQNQRLKIKVSEQSDIIVDITGKIRLLEQAIDEYQRNLTSRDHTLHDYQNKETQYISHINELQRTIDEIVRLKQKNQQIMVVYEDMKTNFQKERTYYTDKIRDYQIKLHIQEDKYNDQIDNLKKKLEFKQHLSKDKENQRPKFDAHSPIQKRAEAPYFKMETLGEKRGNSSMDMMIDQIETNKGLITKSANKLIALLDISQ